MPAPTVVVINPKNAHAHLIYQLVEPVFWRADHDDAQHHAPMRFYERIRSAYTAALGADPAYPGLLVKNPLHPQWRTIWTGRTYELGELAEALPSDVLAHTRFNMRRAHSTETAVGEVVQDGRRNEILFNRARFFAYSIARQAPNEAALRATVMEFAITHNQTFRPPISMANVRAKVNSISKFAWLNRKNFGVKRAAVDPRVTKEHRQDGVRRAREHRRQQLCERVGMAAADLRAQGRPVTASAIRRLTGIHRSTISSLLTKSAAAAKVGTTGQFTRTNPISDTRRVEPGGGRIPYVHDLSVQIGATASAAPEGRDVRSEAGETGSF